MKTIAMIMTLAAGLATFGFAASAENATKAAGARTAKGNQTVVLSGLQNSFQSGFLPSSASSGKQPAWVTYGSTRQ
jgi:hypothetical protein